ANSGARFLTTWPRRALARRIWPTALRRRNRYIDDSAFGGVVDQLMRDQREDCAARRHSGRAGIARGAAETAAVSVEHAAARALDRRERGAQRRAAVNGADGDEVSVPASD